MGRVITAIIGAAAMVALYIALIYGFIRHVWPILPAWLSLLCFIALAVFAIGSPIFWLLRLSKGQTVPPHLRGKR